MLALIFDKEVRLVSTYPKPVAGKGEVLIQVSLAGICATDLEIGKGYKEGFQGVLGHEFVGVIAEARDSSWLGKRVCGDINIGCGTCDWCQAGVPSQCRSRKAIGIFHRDGAFARFLALPLSNLYIVPDQLSDEKAVFVEPLAAALQVLSMAHIRSSDRVGVVGDGKLGLLVAQAVALTGATVTVVGRHPEKLELAANWGLATEWPTVPQDVVVECSGNQGGLKTAISLVKPRGTIVLKSTYHGEAKLDLSSLVVDEIQLIGSRCGPFEPAIRLLNQDRIKVEPLIEAIYDLKDGIQAIEHAGRQGALKVLLKP